MNGWVEAPPKKGLGCFARGCLILAVFAILLILACIAGMFWGMRTHSALTRGFFWLTKIHAVANTASPIPGFTPSESGTSDVMERWKTFRKTIKKGQPAEIALTAEDLNNLIASNRDAAGKAFVAIEDNRFRVQVSIPLAKITGRSGYFVNGDIMVQTNRPEPIDNPPLTGITVNNEPLPGDLLDWRYGTHKFRDYLGQWGEVYHAGTFEVRDGKVILRSGN